MVKECVANKSELRKNGRQKPFGPQLSEADIDASVEKLLILEFLMKQLFYVGLLDIYISICGDNQEGTLYTYCIYI